MRHAAFGRVELCKLGTLQGVDIVPKPDYSKVTCLDCRALLLSRAIVDLLLSHDSVDPEFQKRNLETRVSDTRECIGEAWNWAVDRCAYERQPNCDFV